MVQTIIHQYLLRIFISSSFARSTGFTFLLLFFFFTLKAHLSFIFFSSQYTVIFSLYKTLFFLPTSLPAFLPFILSHFSIYLTPISFYNWTVFQYIWLYLLYFQNMSYEQLFLICINVFYYISLCFFVCIVLYFVLLSSLCLHSSHEVMTYNSLLLTVAKYSVACNC